MFCFFYSYFIAKFLLDSVEYYETFDIYLFFFFQSTETGENGVIGALVPKLVIGGHSQENENATHQLHSMVARNVMDSLPKPKLVTGESHAPVSLYILDYMVQSMYSPKSRKKKTSA